MEYFPFGEAEVPKLGFGTWQLDDSAVERMVTEALSIGYRHIDTAQAYENESGVGRGMKNSAIDREDIWLTTKVWRDNLVPERFEPSVDSSLERLGVDYVDLLLIHWPSNELEIEAYLDELQAIAEKGKARYVGVSNFTTEHLAVVEQRGINILTNQVEYHPFLDQSFLLDALSRMNASLTAYSPLARGRVLNHGLLVEIGENYGKSPVQVALRWLIQQANVMAIPKSSSTKHAEANFDIFDFKLDDEQMELITSLTSRNKRIVNPSWSPDWD